MANEAYDLLYKIVANSLTGEQLPTLDTLDGTEGFLVFKPGVKKPYLIQKDKVVFPGETVTTFLGLTDTEGSYTGQDGKILFVKTGGGIGFKTLAEVSGITAQAVIDALGYTPANDSGVVKDVLDSQGNSLKTGNTVNLPPFAAGESIYINVKDYGTVGDGIADDTIAVQNAINSISHQTIPLYDPATLPSGYIIDFPKGEYLIKDTLLILGNLTLKGNNSKIIFRPELSKDLFNVDQTKYTWSDTQKIHFNFNIKEFSINGDYDPRNLTGNADKGLNLTNVAFSKIEDVFISGFKNNILFGKIEGTVGYYYNSIERVSSRGSDLHLDIKDAAALTVTNCSFSGGSGNKPNLRNLVRVDASGVSFFGCHFENTTEEANTNFAHINLVSGIVNVYGGYSEGAKYFAEINLLEYLSSAGKINLQPTNTSNGSLYFYNSSDLKSTTTNSYTKSNISSAAYHAITRNSTFQSGSNGLQVLEGLSTSYEALDTIVGRHSLRVEKISETFPRINLTTLFDTYGIVNNLYLVVLNPDNVPLNFKLFDGEDQINSGTQTKVAEYDNGIQIYVRKLSESIKKDSLVNIEMVDAPLGSVINLLALYASDSTTFVPATQNSLKNYIDTIPTEGQYDKGDIIYNGNPIDGSYEKWICTSEGIFGAANDPVLQGSSIIGFSNNEDQFLHKTGDETKYGNLTLEDDLSISGILAIGNVAASMSTGRGVEAFNISGFDVNVAEKIVELGNFDASSEQYVVGSILMYNSLSYGNKKELKISYRSGSSATYMSAYLESVGDNVYGNQDLVTYTRNEITYIGIRFSALSTSHRFRYARFNGLIDTNNELITYDAAILSDVTPYIPNKSEKNIFASKLTLNGSEILHKGNIEAEITEIERTFTAAQTFKEIHVEEATEDTHAVNLGQVKAKEDTGTAVVLDKVSGRNYNYATPSNATTYTFSSPVVNGFARCFINTASEPTVTGATKIKGASFVADTVMEMVVESPDGVNVEYYFLER